MIRRLFIAACTLLSVLAASAVAVRAEPSPPPTPPADLTVPAPQAPWNPTPYAQWKNGPGKDEDYFVHQFEPKFNEHALLDNPDMLATVTAVNQQITSLARVLNSPTVVDGVVVESTNPKTPVHAIVKCPRCKLCRGCIPT